MFFFVPERSEAENIWGADSPDLHSAISLTRMEEEMKKVQTGAGHQGIKRIVFSVSGVNIDSRGNMTVCYYRDPDIVGNLSNSVYNILKTFGITSVLLVCWHGALSITTRQMP